MIVSKNLENLENSAVKLTVTVAKDTVNEEYQALLKKYSKGAHIKGFRKGKAPASVLEKKFGEAIRGEASMNIMENSLKEAYEDIEKKPLPYSVPELQEESDTDLDLEKDFTYVVKYDTYPEFEVGEYKGLEIEVPACSVLKKDVDKELETLREQNAIVVDKAEGKVADGDIVNLNYIELDGEGSEVEETRREDFVFTVGSGYNLYKIDKDVIGMAKEEEKVIEKSYPEDFEVSTLAGTEKKLKVKINNIKTKNMPDLDDELAQDISDEYETLDDLKKSIKKRLTEGMNSTLDEKKKEALMDKVLETTEIPVPRAMIDAELEQAWNNFVSRSGMQEDQVEMILQAQGKKKEDLYKEWEADALRSVKTALVMRKLIEQENIEVSDADMDAELKKQAESADMDIEEAKKYFAENNLSDYLKNDLKNRKLFELLLKDTKVKKGEKISYEELMKKGA